MIAILLYTTAMSLLVGASAFMLERVFAALGWPYRRLWLATMVTSIALPAMLVASASAPSETTPVALADTVSTNPTEAGPDVVALQHAGQRAGLLESFRSAIRFQWPEVPQLDTGITYLWLSMSAALLTFYAIGWLHLRRSMRGWENETLQEAPVFVSERTGPAVVGFLKPRIVLPRWALHSTARKLIVAHELEHVKARDPMYVLVALASLAVAPWNPLLWWQYRRLRLAIEIDCDARVLRGDVDINNYGETLLSIGQRSSRAFIGAMAMGEPVSQLERRILIMTTHTTRRSKLFAFGAVAIATSCLTVAAELKAPAKAPTVIAQAAPGANAKSERLNMRLKDADVRDLLALLAHDSAQNVYINSKIGGKLSIEFSETLRADALDMVLRTQHLVKRQEGNSLYIDPSADAIASRVYVGERINLQVSEVDVRAVLRRIADVSRQNIVVSNRVNKNVSVDLKDVPADQALDIVLKTSGLTSKQAGNVLLIDLPTP